MHSIIAHYATTMLSPWYPPLTQKFYLFMLFFNRRSHHNHTITLYKYSRNDWCSEFWLGKWFITYVDEPSGTFFFLSPTHRQRICPPYDRHTTAIRPPSARPLSPIDNTSIEHEIANLSLTTLLPFSFIIIKKEENLRPLVHTSRAHWYTHLARIGTHIPRPLVHASRAHWYTHLAPIGTHIAHTSCAHFITYCLDLYRTWDYKIIFTTLIPFSFLFKIKEENLRMALR